jgi:hypothetical protein
MQLAKCARNDICRHGDAEVVMFGTQSAPLCMMLVTVQLAAGCIPIMNNPPYPIEWPAPAPERIGSCPVISGTYANQGNLYIEAGIACPPRIAGRWSCDLQLAPNLGIDLPAASVAITQPDAETLIVGLLDERGIARQTLHLGKDYQCDATSLYFSSTGSYFNVAGGAALQLKRAFVRDAKGDLVMTVREDTQALLVFIGVLKSDTSHVRWMPVGTAEVAAGKVP